jgi:type III pantothenate kinase
MKKQRQTLLAIDIGNSTVGLGLYPDAEKRKPFFIKTLASVQAASSGTLSGLVKEFMSGKGRSFPAGDIAVVISSVVPGLNHKVITAVKNFCRNPLIVDYRTAGGLSFKVPRPEMIGSDRIVNALAGFSLFGKPAAVVDFGTATTITVIGKHAVFLGGAIMPGMDMMRHSLAARTAKLPEVSLAAPRLVTGRDTASAITSGIVNGTAGAVDRIIRGLEDEACCKLSVILTGGHASLISPFLKRKHILVPHLIFEGMRLIFMQTRLRESVRTHEL